MTQDYINRGVQAQTTKLGLTKVAVGTEDPVVDAINANADILDGAVGCYDTVPDEPTHVPLKVATYHFETEDMVWPGQQPIGTCSVEAFPAVS